MLLRALSVLISHNRSTNAPTIPTTAPSASPTVQSCLMVIVDLSNFVLFSFSELDQNIDDQDLISNATLYAIVDVASVSGIDQNDFNVTYLNSWGSNEYIDGKLRRSLHIEQEMCLFETSYGDYDAMELIIENDNVAIGEALLERLKIVFFADDDVAAEQLEVGFYGSASMENQSSTSSPLAESTDEEWWAPFVTRIVSTFGFIVLIVSFVLLTVSGLIHKKWHKLDDFKLMNM